jgi:chorismate mutase
MKFSKLAQVYDRIAEASGDAGKVPIDESIREADTLERVIKLYKQAH